MNIRRQYNLPNCTLVLEGLSDGSDPQSLRPPLSIVVNVQCQFVGINQTLEGGRSFLESLAQVVSHYAQTCLSGIPHSPPPKTNDEYCELTPLPDPSLHRLTWHPASELHQAPVSIDLSTVQLFDLVEAVDQFIADSQTLPDFSLKLAPASRRFRPPDEPLAQRLVPATIGFIGLAVAAVGVYLLPIPEVKKPEPKPAASPTRTIPTAPTSPPRP
ncbi:DUF4335 domain-containing protein [Synechocystis sp. LKSZ1]|uniref:DUF4335 domain-containing protein n=1 Tax=Synechocystis sp. LKSZ1 TaxID=3144951 RepID=UPI00336BDA4D